MLRTVIATRYVTPFREGGSLPGLCEADDDGLYVVKFRGAGQGPKALVAEVIAACAAIGVRQMIAVIGDSANAGSIGLHRSLGFEDAGVGRAFGFKFGRWVDVVWMQKTLGPGSDAPPDGGGLAL